MIKKIMSLSAVCAVMLCLCSCKGYRETDNEYYVSTVCFEKEKNGFRAFVEVLVISPNDKETKNRTFDSFGETPYAAVEGVTSSMPKTAVFDHCSTAIIGSRITGKDFKSVVKYLYDTKNLNLGVYMFTADDIGEILKLKPQTASVGYDIKDIESNMTSNTGISFKNRYYEICSRQISSGGFCLPEVTEKDGRPAVSGQTVYCDYLPVITLGKEDAMIYNLIYSGSGGGEIGVAGKKCRFNKVSSDVSCRGSTVKIRVKCRYRNPGESKNKALKTEIKRLIGKLYGNAALKVLGAAAFENIDSAEVSVSGK